MNDKTKVFLKDCLEGMREYPDGHFELAIVDPEYRDVNQPDQTMRAKDSQKMKHWRGTPKQDYFTELTRVSKEQMIFGGNYFTNFLSPNNNWVLWYKNNDGTHMSMAEMVWSSIRKNVKVYELRPHGLCADFHPTSKPVEIYKWLLKNYAKPGDKILDTHLGSGSSRIAAYDMGFDFTGYEIDPDYFAAQEKRFAQFKAQTKLFV